jgi:putative membrane protein
LIASDGSREPPVGLRDCTISDMEVTMSCSKHVRRTAFAAFFCALASMSAHADRQTNDQSFVTQVVQANIAEVELGKIAMTRSTNSDVRTFAALMVEDYSRANDELVDLVQEQDIDVPSSLDEYHRGIVADVSSRTGEEFDAAYVKQMAADHAGAVSFFRSAAVSEDLSPALANFASRVVPMVERHKQMAQDLGQY